MLTNHCSVNGTTSVCLQGRALCQTSGLSERSAHCSHYSGNGERYVCVLPNPLFKPHLPPLLPFLFHTLSAVLTHSFSARPKKTGRAAPQSGTPVPDFNPDGRAFATHSRKPLFRSAEETWRWFIRRFIVCHSMDFLICHLHIKVTVLSAFCDYFLRASFSSFYCKTMYFSLNIS